MPRTSLTVLSLVFLAISLDCGSFQFVSWENGQEVLGQSEALISGQNVDMVEKTSFETEHNDNEEKLQQVDKRALADNKIGKEISIIDNKVMVLMQLAQNQNKPQTEKKLNMIKRKLAIIRTKSLNLRNPKMKKKFYKTLRKLKNQTDGIEKKLQFQQNEAQNVAPLSSGRSTKSQLMRGSVTTNNPQILKSLYDRVKSSVINIHKLKEVAGRNNDSLTLNVLKKILKKLAAIKKLSQKPGTDLQKLVSNLSKVQVNIDKVQAYVVKNMKPTDSRKINEENKNLKEVQRQEIYASIKNNVIHAFKLKKEAEKYQYKSLITIINSIRKKLAAVKSLTKQSEFNYKRMKQIIRKVFQNLLKVQERVQYLKVKESNLNKGNAGAPVERKPQALTSKQNLTKALDKDDKKGNFLKNLKSSVITTVKLKKYAKTTKSKLIERTLQQVLKKMAAMKKLAQKPGCDLDKLQQFLQKTRKNLNKIKKIVLNKWKDHRASKIKRIKIKMDRELNILGKLRKMSEKRNDKSSLKSIGTFSKKIGLLSAICKDPKGDLNRVEKTLDLFSEEITKLTKDAKMFLTNLDKFQKRLKQSVIMTVKIKKTASKFNQTILFDIAKKALKKLAALKKMSTKPKVDLIQLGNMLDKIDKNMNLTKIKLKGFVENQKNKSESMKNEENKKLRIIFFNKLEKAFQIGKHCKNSLKASGKQSNKAMLKSIHHLLGNINKLKKAGQNPKADYSLLLKKLMTHTKKLELIKNGLKTENENEALKNGIRKNVITAVKLKKMAAKMKNKIIAKVINKILKKLSALKKMSSKPEVNTINLKEKLMIIESNLNKIKSSLLRMYKMKKSQTNLQKGGEAEKKAKEKGNDKLSKSGMKNKLMKGKKQMKMRKKGKQQNKLQRKDKKKKNGKKQTKLAMKGKEHRKLTRKDKKQKKLKNGKKLRRKGQKQRKLIRKGKRKQNKLKKGRKQSNLKGKGRKHNKLQKGMKKTTLRRKGKKQSKLRRKGKKQRKVKKGKKKTNFGRKGKKQTKMRSKGRKLKNIKKDQRKNLIRGNKKNKSGRKGKKQLKLQRNGKKQKTLKKGRKQTNLRKKGKQHKNLTKGKQQTKLHSKDKKQTKLRRKGKKQKRLKKGKKQTKKHKKNRKQNKLRKKGKKQKRLRKGRKQTKSHRKGRKQTKLRRIGKKQTRLRKGKKQTKLRRKGKKWSKLQRKGKKQKRLKKGGKQTKKHRKNRKQNKLQKKGKKQKRLRKGRKQTKSRRNGRKQTKLRKGKKQKMLRKGRKQTKLRRKGKKQKRLKKGRKQTKIRRKGKKQSKLRKKGKKLKRLRKGRKQTKSNRNGRKQTKLRRKGKKRTKSRRKGRKQTKVRRKDKKLLQKRLRKGRKQTTLRRKGKKQNKKDSKGTKLRRKGKKQKRLRKGRNFGKQTKLHRKKQSKLRRKGKKQTKLRRKGKKQTKLRKKGKKQAKLRKNSRKPTKVRRKGKKQRKLKKGRKQNQSNRKGKQQNKHKKKGKIGKMSKKGKKQTKLITKTSKRKNKKNSKVGRNQTSLKSCKNLTRRIKGSVNSVMKIKKQLQNNSVMNVLNVLLKKLAGLQKYAKKANCKKAKLLKKLKILENNIKKINKKIVFNTSKKTKNKLLRRVKTATKLTLKLKKQAKSQNNKLMMKTLIKVMKELKAIKKVSSKRKTNIHSLFKQMARIENILKKVKANLLGRNRTGKYIIRKIQNIGASARKNKLLAQKLPKGKTLVSALTTLLKKLALVSKAVKRSPAKIVKLVPKVLRLEKNLKNIKLMIARQSNLKEIANKILLANRLISTAKQLKRGNYVNKIKTLKKKLIELKAQSKKKNSNQADIGRKLKQVRKVLLKIKVYLKHANIQKQQRVKKRKLQKKVKTLTSKIKVMTKVADSTKSKNDRKKLNKLAKSLNKVDNKIKASKLNYRSAAKDLRKIETDLKAEKTVLKEKKENQDDKRKVKLKKHIVITVKKVKSFIKLASKIKQRKYLKTLNSLLQALKKIMKQLGLRGNISYDTQSQSLQNIVKKLEKLQPTIYKEFAATLIDMMLNKRKKLTVLAKNQNNRKILDMLESPEINDSLINMKVNLKTSKVKVKTLFAKLKKIHTNLYKIYVMLTTEVKQPPTNEAVKKAIKSTFVAVSMMKKVAMKHSFRDILDPVSELLRKITALNKLSLDNVSRVNFVAKKLTDIKQSAGELKKQLVKKLKNISKGETHEDIAKKKHAISLEYKWLNDEFSKLHSLTSHFGVPENLKAKTDKLEKMKTTVDEKIKTVDVTGSNNKTEAIDNLNSTLNNMVSVLSETELMYEKVLPKLMKTKLKDLHSKHNEVLNTAAVKNTVPKEEIINAQLINKDIENMLNGRINTGISEHKKFKRHVEYNLEDYFDLVDRVEQNIVALSTKDPRNKRDTDTIFSIDDYYKLLKKIEENHKKLQEAGSGSVRNVTAASILLMEGIDNSTKENLVSYLEQAELLEDKLGNIKVLNTKLPIPSNLKGESDEQLKQLETVFMAIGIVKSNDDAENINVKLKSLMSELVGIENKYINVLPNIVQNVLDQEYNDYSVFVSSTSMGSVSAGDKQTAEFLLGEIKKIRDSDVASRLTNINTVVTILADFFKLQAILKTHKSLIANTHNASQQLSIHTKTQTDTKYIDTRLADDLDTVIQLKTIAEMLGNSNDTATLNSYLVVLTAMKTLTGDPEKNNLLLKITNLERDIDTFKKKYIISEDDFNDNVINATILLNEMKADAERLQLAPVLSTVEKLLSNLTVLRKGCHINRTKEVDYMQKTDCIVQLMKIQSGAESIKKSIDDQRNTFRTVLKIPDETPESTTTVKESTTLAPENTATLASESTTNVTLLPTTTMHVTTNPTPSTTPALTEPVVNLTGSLKTLQDTLIKDVKWMEDARSKIKFINKVFNFPVDLLNTVNILFKDMNDIQTKIYKIKSTADASNCKTSLDKIKSVLINVEERYREILPGVLKNHMEAVYNNQVKVIDVATKLKTLPDKLNEAKALLHNIKEMTEKKYIIPDMHDAVFILRDYFDLLKKVEGNHEEILNNNLASYLKKFDVVEGKVLQMWEVVKLANFSEPYQKEIEDFRSEVEKIGQNLRNNKNMTVEEVKNTIDEIEKKLNEYQNKVATEIKNQIENNDNPVEPDIVYINNCTSNSSVNATANAIIQSHAILQRGVLVGELFNIDDRINKLLTEIHDKGAFVSLENYLVKLKNSGKDMEDKVLKNKVTLPAAAEFINAVNKRLDQIEAAYDARMKKIQGYANVVNLDLNILQKLEDKVYDLLGVNVDNLVNDVDEQNTGSDINNIVPNRSSGDEESIHNSKSGASVPYGNSHYSVEKPAGIDALKIPDANDYGALENNGMIPLTEYLNHNKEKSDLLKESNDQNSKHNIENNINSANRVVNSNGGNYFPGNIEAYNKKSGEEGNVNPISVDNQLPTKGQKQHITHIDLNKNGIQSSYYHEIDANPEKENIVSDNYKNHKNMNNYKVVNVANPEMMNIHMGENGVKILKRENRNAVDESNDPKSIHVDVNNEGDVNIAVPPEINNVRQDLDSEEKEEKIRQQNVAIEDDLKESDKKVLVTDLFTTTVGAVQSSQGAVPKTTIAETDNVILKQELTSAKNSSQTVAKTDMKPAAELKQPSVSEEDVNKVRGENSLLTEKFDNLFEYEGQNEKNNGEDTVNMEMSKFAAGIDQAVDNGVLEATNIQKNDNRNNNVQNQQELDDNANSNYVNVIIDKQRNERSTKGNEMKLMRGKISGMKRSISTGNNEYITYEELLNAMEKLKSELLTTKKVVVKTPLANISASELEVKLMKYKEELKALAKVILHEMYLARQSAVSACDSNPCQNSGNCLDSGNGNYVCDCATGTFGSRCEYVIDYCEEHPCKNDGTCYSAIGFFRCECTTGWTGILCEERTVHCTSQPCQNGGTCNEGKGSYNCTCPKGYSGENCEINIDECASQPCQNGGKCMDLVNSYTCACDHMYTGKNCQTELNVCSSEPCQHGGTCLPSADSTKYTCHCVQDFFGENCEVLSDYCGSGPCHNNGTCIPSKDGKYFNCSCGANWSGDYCEVFSATACDPNPCQPDEICDKNMQTGAVTCNSRGNQYREGSPCLGSPCRNNATCIDFLGESDSSRFACQCTPEYQGRLCSQPNPCGSDPCLNGGVCESAGNTFKCVCPAQYHGLSCEEKLNDLCSPNPCQDGYICEEQDDVKEGFVCRAESRTFQNGPQKGQMKMKNTLNTDNIIDASEDIFDDKVVNHGNHKHLQQDNSSNSKWIMWLAIVMSIIIVLLIIILIVVIHHLYKKKLLSSPYYQRSKEKMLNDEEYDGGNDELLNDDFSIQAVGKAEDDFEIENEHQRKNEVPERTPSKSLPKSPSAQSRNASENNNRNRINNRNNNSSSKKKMSSIIKNYFHKQKSNATLSDDDELDFVINYDDSDNV